MSVDLAPLTLSSLLHLPANNTSTDRLSNTNTYLGCSRTNTGPTGPPGPPGNSAFAVGNITNCSGINVTNVAIFAGDLAIDSIYLTGNTGTIYACDAVVFNINASDRVFIDQTNLGVNTDTPQNLIDVTTATGTPPLFQVYADKPTIYTTDSPFQFNGLASTDTSIVSQLQYNTASDFNLTLYQNGGYLTNSLGLAGFEIAITPSGNGIIATTDYQRTDTTGHFIITAVGLPEATYPGGQGLILIYLYDTQAQTLTQQQVITSPGDIIGFGVSLAKNDPLYLYFNNNGNNAYHSYRASFDPVTQTFTPTQSPALHYGIVADPSYVTFNTQSGSGNNQVSNIINNGLPEINNQNNFSVTLPPISSVGCTYCISANGQVAISGYGFTGVNVQAQILTLQPDNSWLTIPQNIYPLPPFVANMVCASSADGSVIVLAYDVAGSNSAFYTFYYNGFNWSQVGPVALPDTDFGQPGCSLSFDGTGLLINAYNSSAGGIYYYTYSGSGVFTLGNYINNYPETFGYCSALSADNTTVAVLSLSPSGFISFNFFSAPDLTPTLNLSPSGFSNIDPDYTLSISFDGSVIAFYHNNNIYTYQKIQGFWMEGLTIPNNTNLYNFWSNYLGISGTNQYLNTGANAYLLNNSNYKTTANGRQGISLVSNALVFTHQDQPIDYTLPFDNYPLTLDYTSTVTSQSQIANGGNTVAVLYSNDTLYAYNYTFNYYKAYQLSGSGFTNIAIAENGVVVVLDSSNNLTIYTFNGTTYTSVSTLITATNLVGLSVNAIGSLVLVGIINAGTYGANLYQISDGTITLIQTFTPSLGNILATTMDSTGTVVAISDGNYIYIYVLLNSTWTLTNPVIGDFSTVPFNLSLSARGTSLAVASTIGSPSEVYVYTGGPLSYQHVNIINPPVNYNSSVGQGFTISDDGLVLYIPAGSSANPISLVYNYNTITQSWRLIYNDQTANYQGGNAGSMARDGSYVSTNYNANSSLVQALNYLTPADVELSAGTGAWLAISTLYKQDIYRIYVSEYENGGVIPNTYLDINSGNIAIPVRAVVSDDGLTLKVLTPQSATLTLTTYRRQNTNSAFALFSSTILTNYTSSPWLASDTNLNQTAVTYLTLTGTETVIDTNSQGVGTQNYLNFGVSYDTSTYGQSGYGIRSYNNTIQVKNNTGDSWNPITTVSSPMASNQVVIATGNNSITSTPYLTIAGDNLFVNTNLLVSGNVNVTNASVINTGYYNTTLQGNDIVTTFINDINTIYFNLNLNGQTIVLNTNVSDPVTITIALNFTPQAIYNIQPSGYLVTNDNNYLSFLFNSYSFSANVLTLNAVIFNVLNNGLPGPNTYTFSGSGLLIMSYV